VVFPLIHWQTAVKTADGKGFTLLLQRTRPGTMFLVMPLLAVAPDDDVSRTLLVQFVGTALVGRRIPIVCWTNT